MNILVNLQVSDTGSTFGAMQTSVVKYGRLLGSLLSAALLVVGLADLPQQLAIWRSWLRDFRGDSPWWVFVLWSALVFVFTWGPAIWKRREGRLAIALKASEVDSLKAQVEKAEAEAERLRSETAAERGNQAKTISGLEQRMHDLGSELADTERRLENWYKEARKERAFSSFGERLIDIEALGDTENKIMRSRVHELLPRLNAALAGAEKVWAILSHAAMAKGELESVHWLALRVDYTEHGRVVRAVAALRECLETSQDPRPFLACTYTRYREWRAWILRFARLMGERLEFVQEYAAWRATDRMFFDDLRGKLEIPELRAVKQAVTEYDNDRSSGPPEELPPRTTS